MRARFSTRTFLGDVEQDEGPNGGRRPVLKVYADLRMVDDLNDPDRERETVEHETVRAGDYPSVSVTWEYGTARELTRGDGSGGAGIDADIVASLASPSARARAERIVALAERWHLNDLRAGCAHQTVVHEDGPYGRRPSLELTAPCPVTGYRYGSAWLLEPVPADELEELRALFGAGAWEPVSAELAERIRASWGTVR